MGLERVLYLTVYCTVYILTHVAITARQHGRGPWRKVARVGLTLGFDTISSKKWGQGWLNSGLWHNVKWVIRARVGWMRGFDTMSSEKRGARVGWTLGFDTMSSEKWPELGGFLALALCLVISGVQDWLNFGLWHNVKKEVKGHGWLNPELWHNVM